MVADILRLMGQPFDKKILVELIEEVDEDSKLVSKRNYSIIFDIKSPLLMLGFPLHLSLHQTLLKELQIMCHNHSRSEM